jgi:hypothetical protein
MKRIIPLLLLACLSSLAQDLNDYGQYSAGTITAANAACTATACVYLAMPLNASAATAVLSGTFSATVQFEASVDGLVWNSIGVGSATSAGSYTFSLTGQRVIRARCSAFTSGSMGVSWGATVGASGGGGVSTAAQVVNLFTGCSGTQYLGADGACHTASGGAGSNAAYTTVTYSATPTFTVTASSTPQIFKITLTGNVTSSTLATSSATAGQQIGLQIVQGSGPYTFAYPSNFIGATPISTANGVLTTCIGVFDGTNVTNPVCTTNDAWHGINLTATVFSTLRSDVSTGSTAWICDNTVTALGTAVTSGSGTCGTGSAIAQLLFNGSGWTLAALGAEANASGWTDNGTTIAAASGRTVTVGNTVLGPTNGVSTPQIVTNGAGSGCYTFAGATSGSASICAASSAGTPSKMQMPTADPAIAGQPLVSGLPSGGAQQTAWGYPAVVAANMIASQTTTQTCLSYSVGSSAAGTYRLSLGILPSSLTGTLAVTGTWTSWGGFSVSGYGLTSQTSTYPTTNIYTLYAQASSTITIIATVTGTSTYNCSATLERLQ